MRTYSWLLPYLAHATPLWATSNKEQKSPYPLYYVMLIFETTESAPLEKIFTCMYLINSHPTNWIAAVKKNAKSNAPKINKVASINYLSETKDGNQSYSLVDLDENIRKTPFREIFKKDFPNILVYNDMPTILKSHSDLKKAAYFPIYFRHKDDDNKTIIRKFDKLDVEKGKIEKGILQKFGLTTSKNNDSNLLSQQHIFIIILALAIIGGGLFYTLTRHNKKQESTKESLSQQDS